MPEGPRSRLWAFRLLLSLYPRSFRAEYGEEMEELVRSRLRRARGVREWLRIRAHLAVDLAANGLTLRRRGWRGRHIHERGGGWVGMMDNVMHDLRYATRTLARNPLFTAGAIALLAVGIGMNAAAFSVVDAFLFRPPPFESPERVVHVYQDSDDGEPSSNSFPATRDMAESPAFSAVAAMTPSSAVWDRTEGPMELSTEYVTSSFMEVTGRHPIRGRWFDPAHDLPGSEPVAVVTAGAWRRIFGADPDIVGRSLSLNGQAVTVIGVGPEGLHGGFGPLSTDLWLSISATPVSGPFQVANLERREDHWYHVRARLADGVSVDQAQSAMNALATRLGERYPEFNRGRGITVFPAMEVRLLPGEDGNLRLAGGLLFGVVFTVLLLACANLANLLLVRGLSRSGEMAVRTALGAGRHRVARIFYSEALLLTTAGGLAGLAVAIWILRVLGSLPFNLPGPFGATASFQIDGRVLVFLLCLMAVTTLVFGLIPAIRGGSVRVASILREDAGTTSPGRTSLRLSNALVVVQMAGSLVLILGTGLLTRSLVELQSADRGVDADRVAYVEVDWNRSGLEGAAGTVFLQDLLERMAALPGVEAAAATSRLPATRSGTTTTEVEGYVPPTGTQAVELPFGLVTDDYFEVVGASIVEGRTFGPADQPGGDAAVIINEAAARRFYGAASPLGRRMRGQGSEDWNRVIVGVVTDTPVNGLREEAEPMTWFSARQLESRPAILVTRTASEAGPMVPSLRAAVRDAGIDLPVQDEGTLSEYFGAALRGPRLAASALGAFSLLALVLAGLGIYTIVSFSVSRRTTELGIRLALGAERWALVRMVLREILGVVAVGLALGLGTAFLIAPWLEGVLFRIPPLDPVAFLGSATLLLAMAALAAYLPARRAARQDPAATLRVS